MTNWIRISKTKIGLSILMVLCEIGTFGYYCYSHDNMIDELRDTSLTECFASYQLMFLMSILPYLVDTGYMIVIRVRNNVVVIPEVMWNMYKPSNNPVGKFLKTTEFVSIGFGIYFTTLFIPFNKGCRGYDNNMCLSFRIASIVEIVRTCYYSAMISIFVFRLFSTRRAANQQINIQTESLPTVTDVLVTNIRQKIIDKLPLTTPPPENDVCNVCLDRSENDQWKQLPCGHKFHPMCVEIWLLHNGTCPVCRRLLTYLETNSSV